MKKAIKIIFQLGLLVCICASLYMRTLLFNMAYEYDELFTAITTDPLVSFGWIYKHWLLVDVHPPLYNAFLWIWNHLVPYGPEIWLRLPSLLFGVSGLVCAWICFPKRLGKTAKWIFVSLLSCNLYVLFYSQHARSYMLMMLLSVPVTFLFLAIFRRILKRCYISKQTWISFAVLSILLSWSHYFGTLLAGICAVFLCLKAVQTKFEVKPASLTLLIIGIGFLPWIIPNFIEQIFYERFSGNWWGNEAQWRFIPWTVLCLLFSNWRGIAIMGILLAVGTGWYIYRWKKTGYIPFVREQLVLLSVCLATIAIVGVVSLKTFLFYGRYFIAFLPSAYLIVCVILAPVVRKNLLAKILCVLFLISNLVVFGRGHQELRYTPKMPVRMLSQIDRDFYRGKEMFVIAVEGFPPVVMPAMYGFYVNRVYGLNVPVTELFSLDEETRNKVLERKEEAFIWMPNCNTEKLQQVANKWHRSLGVYGRLPDTCILKISD